MANSDKDIDSAIEELMAGATGTDETDKPETEESDEPAATDREAELEADIEALKSERDEMRDRWMRALADAENSRKRADRDRKEAENYGGSKLARDLLPVYDNLSRALHTVTDEQREANTALIEGIELTLRELVNVYSKHGITPIEPKVGDRFDPQYHEAMFEAPVPDTKAGDIIQVSAVGFMLHDRLLRPAHVGVSSSPAS
ncbi:molecular chaperone GrpE [Tranquillimonas rosea]|uniref:Protein GrpE n=2 Tax=Tranquillimonas rosea TaxID=641238 RepID=A0A1H9UFB6_9RHOB|nr:nucleotide exchange factor GrpE [Tranquillimonas rosea]SES08250.1 molecular chaperone GrpE [Tranquillimonas rosea]